MASRRKNMMQGYRLGKLSRKKYTWYTNEYKKDKKKKGGIKRV